MPALIIPVAAIAAGSIASAVVGGGVLGAVAATAASVGVAYGASQLLGTNRSASSAASASGTTVAAAATATGITQTVKESIAAHRLIYGRTRVGGVIVYEATRAPAGTNKLDVLDLVIVLAAHQVEAIDEIYFEDTVVTLDASGNATSAPFVADGKPLVRITRHLGSPDQGCDTELVANSAGAWTSAHRLRGRAYLYCQLTWNQTAFPAGRPNISAVVRGKRLYDPRSGATAWSNNAALAVLDYLRSPYGLVCELAEIDTVAFAAAATLCDEAVDRPGGQERRYTCDGALDVSSAPVRVLPLLLSALAGRLTYTAGQWRLFAGAFLPPTVILDETAARDTLTVRPRRSRRDLINTVRGTFFSPAHGWQATDYPPVQPAGYLAEDDGEEIALSLDLQFTASPYMAQRIARITVEARRRQLTVSFPANLAGLRLVAGQTLGLTIPTIGLVNRAMQVSQWQLTEQMGVNLELTEEADAIYALAPGDLVTMDAQPALSLGSNADIAPATPTGLVASLIGSDVRLTWSTVDESDFSHFEVWESSANSAPGSLIAETHQTDYRRSGLMPGTSRFWWVAKVDRHLNRSGYAGPVSATTPGSAAQGLLLA